MREIGSNPKSHHRHLSRITSRRIRVMVVAAAAILVLAALSGCGNETTDPPNDVSPIEPVRAAMNRLPTVSTRISQALPPAIDGSYLFGVEFENGTRLHVTAASARMLAGTIVDEQQRALWSEIRTPDSLSLVLPTGDCLVFSKRGDHSQVAIVLAATSPVTRFVLVEGADGQMYFDEAASRLGALLAEPGSATHDRALRALGWGSAVGVLGETDACHERATSIAEAINAACDIYSLFSATGIEQKVLEFVCVANDRLLEWASDQAPGSEQIVAAIQAGLSAVCTASSYIIEGVGAILDPGTLFCLIASDGQTLWQATTGESFDDWLGAVICGDVCSEGRERNEETNACECIAPQAEAASGECVCPNGGVFDPHLGTCDCGGGQMPNPSTGQCECPRGMDMDPFNQECACPAGMIEDPTADWDTQACLTCAEGAQTVCDLREQAMSMQATADEIMAAIERCNDTPGCDSGPLYDDYYEWYTRITELISAQLGIYLQALLVVQCPNIPDMESCIFEEGLKSRPDLWAAMQAQHGPVADHGRPWK